MIDDAPGVSGAAPSASDPASAETDGPPGSPAYTHAVLGSPAATDADIGWRRLAPGMLLVDPVREIIKFIPLLIVLLFAGRAGESGPPWGLIGAGVVIALGISRWLTTRYRITPTVVEVRRGLFQRKHLTVPRDRVRTVDISAHPLQRVLRLVKVQIGTGISHQGSESLALDGLPAATAGALRAELLHREMPHREPPHRKPGHSDPSRREPAQPHPPQTDPAHPHPPPPHPLQKDPAHPHAPRPHPLQTDPAQPHQPQQHQPPPHPLLTVQPLHRDVDPDRDSELARLDPRWIKYAPATLSGVVTAAFLIGLGWRIVNEARLDPTQISAVNETLRYLHATPLWLDIVLVVAVVTVAIAILSVAGYVLSFWGFRLSRHPGGTLQVGRGLLTTRATSIEERRLHGVERVESLLLRLVGGARLQAIATGLRQRGSERGSALLVPPAPLATVLVAEAAILGSDAVGRAPLRTHGPAARRRRFSRALGVAAIPVATLFALFVVAGWPITPAMIGVLTLPLSALLARDRYRSLGHAVIDDRLVVRVGSLVRRRSVLAVPGIIGVTLRQSIFQRRSGLFTLTATTAAGSQRYDVPDLPEGTAIDLAVLLVPQCQTFRTTAPAAPYPSG